MLIHVQFVHHVSHCYSITVVNTVPLIVSANRCYNSYTQYSLSCYRKLVNISNYKIYFQVSEVVGRIACGGRRCSVWIFLHLEATPRGMG
jgi:hypothetical protein